MKPRTTLIVIYYSLTEPLEVKTPRPRSVTNLKQKKIILLIKLGNFFSKYFLLFLYTFLNILTWFYVLTFNNKIYIRQIHGTTIATFSQIFCHIWNK